MATFICTFLCSVCYQGIPFSMRTMFTACTTTSISNSLAADDVIDVNEPYTFYSDDWDTVCEQSKLSVPNKMWVGIAAAVFLQPLYGHTARGVVPLFVGMSIAMDSAQVSSSNLTNQTIGLFDQSYALNISSQQIVLRKSANELT